MPPIVDEALVMHASSGGDWNGRLFTLNGSLYRGVGAGSAPLYQGLFREGIIQSLCEKQLLIPSEIAELTTVRYPFVVRHRKIPFVSYPAEWPAGMLKAAALCVLDLELELIPHGLSIHDAHPWNVVFDGTQPFFVDLGAIMPLENDSIWSFPRLHPQWPAFDQFCGTMLYPLLLMSWGHHRIARTSLLDYSRIGEGEMARLAPWRLLARHPFWRWSLHRVRAKIGEWAAPLNARLLNLRIARSALDAEPKRKNSRTTTFRSTPSISERLKFVHRLRDRVASIQTAALPQGAPDYIGGVLDRTKYYDALHGGQVPSVTSNENWTVKNHTVAGVLSRVRPTSVLDLGCSVGWYSLLAAEMGAHVTACDVDEACAETLYRTARDRNIKLLPLRMDFRSPTPGMGPCNEWLLPATERLRSDMVLSLALVHHLVFKQYLTFDQIVRTLDQFSNRWAVVEFILPGDEWVQDLLRPEFAWYTLDNFEHAIRKYFPHIEIFPSYPEQRRILFCEKQPYGGPVDTHAA